MFIFILLTTIILLIPKSVLAMPLLPPCTYDGNCGVCDMVQVIANYYWRFLGLLGGLVFLYFVIGAAWFFVYGRGNAEKVQRGKDVMWNSMYGMLIVLISWQLINFILFAVGTKVGSEMYTGSTNAVQDLNSPAFSGAGEKSISYRLFGNPWHYICEAPKDPTDMTQDQYNRAVCFSLGNGTPCAYMSVEKNPDGTIKSKTIKKFETNPGSCLNGACTPGSGCEYLASKFNDYFGARDGWTINNRKVVPDTDKLAGYTCTTVDPIKHNPADFDPVEEKYIPKPANKDGLQLNRSWDCLHDAGLCSTGKLCCGIVQGAVDEPY